jgi:hypothetical protein
MTDLSTPEAQTPPTPGLRILASLTDLEGYIEFYMLFGKQSAERQAWRCPNLRGPTLTRSGMERSGSSSDP